MLAQLRSSAASLLSRMRGLSLPSSESLAKLVPVVLLAIGLTVLAMMYIRYDDSRYKALFGKGEKVAVADMMEVLDSEHIRYRIHPDTGQVLVPKNELGKIRMLLAAKGVVAKLPVGLEQVDRNDSLGVSRFVQEVRFRRGLEGELTQSIMTLNPVASARVHLSIARSSSFVIDDGAKSSASVVLKLKPGQRLSKEQVAAIINLVAGSVANLDPKRVTVVDQTGDLLSAHLDLNEGFHDDDKIVAHFREEALRNIRDLLTPILGENNFRASVTVEVDNDRIEETREQYGEQPKLLNEATRDEQDHNQIPLGVPGSLSNRPVETDETVDSDQEGTRSLKNAVTRQYAYDRSVMRIKRGHERLKRLSVAVVLNNAAAPGGSKAWAPEQLTRIERMLRNGLGIDSKRHDKLEVSALDFPPPAMPTPWWKRRSTLIDAGSYLGYSILALLAFLFVLRPLLKILQQWMRANMGGGVPIPSLPGAPELAAETAATTRVLPAAALLSDASLPPEGSAIDVLVDHLKTLASKDPERVAEVIKQWIRKNDGVG